MCFSESIIGIAGSTMLRNDTIVSDASDGDFWNPNDKGVIVYKAFSGDGEVIARVVDFDGVQAFSQAGIMFRETLNDDSKMAFMMLGYDWGPIFRARALTAGAVVQVPASKTMAKAPYWLKLVREGDLFYGFHSPDGIKWTLERSATVQMQKDIYVCLAAATHSSLSNGFYSFSDINIKSSVAVDESFRDASIIVNIFQNRSISLKSIQNNIHTEIYSADGKQILQSKKYEINIEGLKPGVYILKSTSGENSLIKKFFVL